MPVDTRNKRFSMIVFGSWNGRVMPNPDGAFSTAIERMHLALSYAISASSVVASPSTINILGSYVPTINIVGRYEA